MKQQLQQLAEQHGCAAIGVTTAAEFPGVAETLQRRDREGLAGRRRFTYKDPERAADVRRSFSWAHSIVTVSWPYLPQAGSPGPAVPGFGRIARFATTDHYAGLRAALSDMQQALMRAGHRAEVLSDDDRLVDRAAAVRAGIAWWGKSTMVLDPRHGPWLLLGSIVTDAELPTDTPMRRDCGTCDSCMPACPTGAIVAPGVLDAARCLAHWMQTAGVFPRDLRAALEDRIYGCDDCLDACPPGHKQLSDGLPIRGQVDLLELLAATDAELLERYTHFYLPGRRPRILRRNAMLALANTWHGKSDTEGAATAVGVLARYLNDDHPILRGHAAWGLGRVGGDHARACLDARLETETDPTVIEEIELARYASGESR